MGKRAKKIKTEINELEQDYENGDTFLPLAYTRAMIFVYLNHVPDDKLDDLLKFIQKILKD